MVKFVAYDDASLYAFGDTPELAIANARRVTGETDGIFKAVPIIDELYAWIEKNGWNGIRRSFSIEHGMLVDTTDR